MPRLLRLALLLILANPAIAQGGLASGQRSMSLPATSWLAGELTPEAPVFSDGSFMHEYTLGSDGSGFEVRLISPVFDTYLVLTAPSGVTYSNDDYADATGESRILVGADSAEVGLWTVRANTLLSGETGAYILAHRPLAPQAPGGAQRVGSWFADELTNDSPILEDSTYFREIALVSDGLPFEVRLTSFDFDPFLVIIAPNGTRYTNDDYLTIRESRIIIPPDSAAAGTWKVWANTYVAGATGEYVLSHRPLAGAELAAIEREYAERQAEALSANVLGLYSAGQAAEAVPLAREAVALLEGEPSEALAEAYLALGFVLEAAGEAGVRETLEEAVTVAESLFGRSSPELAPFLDHLGTAAYREDDFAAAAAAYERALDVLAPPPPPPRFEAEDPSDTGEPVAMSYEAPQVGSAAAVVLFNLASTREAQGDLDGASSLYETVLASEERTLDPDDPEIAITLFALASVRQRLGDLDDARDLYRRALDIQEEASDREAVTDILVALARLEVEAGHYGDARDFYKRALAAQEADLGGDHPETAALINAVGEIVQLQAFADAQPFYERALEVQAAALGDDDEATIRTRNNLERLVAAQEDLLAGAPPTRSRGPRGREEPSPLVRQGLDRAILFATNAYSDTSGTWSNLSNPILDAEAIARELHDRYGFDTLVVRNPTRTEILDELRRARKTEVPENGQLFVFFAGHGTVDGDGPRDPGYLIPSDGGDRPSADWVNYDNLAGELGRMPDHRVLAVFDACRGGSFFKERRSQSATDPPLSPREIVAEYARYASRLAVTSGARQQDVSDGSPGEHSPFAYQILEALRSGGGPNQDGLLLFNELLTYTQPVDGQSPLAGDFGYGHEAGGTFFFLDADRAQAAATHAE